MSSSPVVGRTQHGPPRTRCRGEEWNLAPGRPAAGTGARPAKLEVCRERDRRSPSAKKAARASYEQKLRRTLERHFPGFAIACLTTGIDLEKSFGPIYARGLLRQGQTAFAVLGVNASETQASIDASRTLGILWLEACRQSSAGKFLVEGLRLFVPHGCSALVRDRMGNLNRGAAKWSLYELNEFTTL